MDAAFKADWVAALRGGHYEQGTGELRSKEGFFCCMGVACDMLNPGGWQQGFDCYIMADSKGLPKTGLMPFNLRERIGLGYQEQSHLASMNDRGDSFLEIADHIETNL